MPVPAAHRLLVLAPAAVPAEALAQRAWQLAAPGGLEILFIGLMQSGQKDYGHLRHLATLAALTRDKRVAVEVYPVETNEWIEAVRQVWRPGDVVICHAEQRATGWRGRRQALGWELVRRLEVPVCIISGLCPRQSAEPSSRIWHLVHDLIALVVIALFFVLQIQIERLPKEWFYYATYSVVVMIEIGLLFIWYTFFRD
jgi:hypothetical protein